MAISHRDSPTSPAALSDAPAEKPETGESASDRSLRLLSLLASEGRPLTLADLAAQLSLPKGTTHRICTQLMATGFIARDVDERSFVVGPALRQLAFDTLNHGVLRGLRHEVLAELVKEVGETCNFTTLDGARVLYLDRVEAHWPLRLSLDVGSHVPLHCTASGKLLLAYLPKKEQEALIQGMTLTEMTRNSITAAEQLRSECEVILKQGYACDNEEFILGLVAVAVPVRNAAGAVRATIAVHAPKARMTLDEALLRLDALKRAAERMGELLS